MGTKSSACPTPAGTLLIIGGKENKGDSYKQNHEEPNGYDPNEVLKTFAEAIEDKQAPIEIVTTGSELGDELFSDYHKIFGDLGFKVINHMHHKERRDVLSDNLSEK